MHRDRCTRIDYTRVYSPVDAFGARGRGGIKGLEALEGVNDLGDQAPRCPGQHALEPGRSHVRGKLERSKRCAPRGSGAAPTGAPTDAAELGA